MDFTEKALEAYNKKRIKDGIKENKDADQFCEKAINVLKEQFGLEEDINIEIIEKLPGSTTVKIEDIIIIIRFSHGYHNFDIIRKCLRCGTEYSCDVRSLEDIGNCLITDHDKFECDRNLNAGLNAGKKVETTQERFINALIDLIREIGQQ